MAEVLAENLDFAYQRTLSGTGNTVLHQMNLVVEAGESVGVIGGNGAGKSTLLKLLAGIEHRYGGRLQVGGIDVRKENLALLRERTGYVFQDSDNQLFMGTVYEDVAFAPENYGLSPEEAAQRTMDALRKVHMEALAGERIYRLSGGQKKLASIATVLSMLPELLLLDEPSVALDPKNRRNLIEILNGLGNTKMIASHDLDFIYDTCDRAILIHEGKISADGDAKEILREEKLLRDNGLELPLSFSRK